ncbi:MAG: hypothetical protein RR800_06925 [Comamonas sp.]
MAFLAKSSGAVERMKKDLRLLLAFSSLLGVLLGGAGLVLGFAASMALGGLLLWVLQKLEKA